MQVSRFSILASGVYLASAAAWIGLRQAGLIQLQTSGLIPPFVDYALLALTAAAFAAVMVGVTRRLSHTGAAVARTQDQLRRQQSLVNALAHTASQLNADRSQGEVLGSICGEAAVALGVDAATILLANPNRGLLEPAASFGLTRDEREVLESARYNDADLLAIRSDAPVNQPLDSSAPAARVHALLRSERSLDTLFQLPLGDSTHTLGVFSILTGRARQSLSADEWTLFQAFAAQASLALRAGRLAADSQTRRSKLESLRAGDLAILSSLDLRTTLDVFLQKVVEHQQVDAADVLLLDPATQMLEYAAGRGFLTNSMEASRVPLGTGLAGMVALERREMFVPDVNSTVPYTRRESAAGENIVTYCAMPLVAKGRILGVLEAFHRTRFRPDADWLSFLRLLAGQASIAIDNASLFSNLQHANTQLAMAYDRTLEGWSRALDLRDRETEGHTQRVTDLCIRLARQLRIPEESLVHMRRGSLLHDIGKMGVPDHVLFKPEAFNEDDQRVMQRHPALAFEMLAPIHYLQPALDIPYCHHERWDGSGYPRGLRGEAIPIAARVFAVVDVWDALTSDRPYRKALTPQGAVEYLRKEAGRQFDPGIVDAFVTLIIDKQGSAGQAT